MSNQSKLEQSRFPTQIVYKHQLDDFKKQCRALRSSILLPVPEFHFSLMSFYEVVSRSLGYSGHSDMIQKAHTYSGKGAPVFSLVDIESISERLLYQIVHYEKKSQYVSKNLIRECLDHLKYGMRKITYPNIRYTIYKHPKHYDFEDTSINEFLFKTASELGKPFEGTDITSIPGEDLVMSIDLCFPESLILNDDQKKTVECLQALTVTGLVKVYLYVGEHAEPTELDHSELSEVSFISRICEVRPALMYGYLQEVSKYYNGIMLGELNIERIQLLKKMIQHHQEMAKSRQEFETSHSSSLLQ